MTETQREDLTAKQALMPSGLYRQAFQSMAFACLFCDQDGKIMDMNQAALAVLRPDAETNNPPIDQKPDRALASRTPAVSDLSLMDYVSADDQTRLLACLGHIMEHHQQVSLKLDMGLKSEKRRQVHISVHVAGRHTGRDRKPDADAAAEAGERDQAADSGNRVFCCYLFPETERSQMPARLMPFSQFDSLTGLPNRQLLIDRIDMAMVSAKRKKSSLAGLFVDFDGFKRINDQYGHSMGDKVLKLMARRMSECLRESDTLARLGGDEFFIIIPDLDDKQMVLQVVRRLNDYIRKPVELGGHHFKLTASIGICFYPDDVTCLHELIECADMAMYQAKQTGRDQFAMFSSALQKEFDQKEKMEHKLRGAITQKELGLHYQPYVDQAGHVIGLEVLLRWTCAPRHCLAAKQFLDTAESIGLNHEFSAWALEQAICQTAQWQKQHVLVPNQSFRVSINLAKSQLQDSSLPDQILRLCHRYDVSPGKIALEIKETDLNGLTSSISQMLCSLAEKGFMFDVDDFSGHYSTLMDIADLPFSRLKLDAALALKNTAHPGGQTLYEAILGLAHTFGLKLLVKGIETETLWQWYQLNGNDGLQGYYLGEPLNPRQTEMFLQMC